MMKLLLVLVTIMAVWAANGRDFSRESEVQDTANEVQLFPEEFNSQDNAQHFLDGPDGDNVEEIQEPAEKAHPLKERSFSGDDDSDSAHQLQDGDLYLEGEKEQNKGKLRRSRCKARNACVMMAGFCVTNVTLCSGRLVAEGCKGNNCQCCVPGTIETKLNNLEEELQSLKEDTNSELQSLKFNMNSSISNIDSKLQNLNIDMNNGNSNINSNLQSLKTDTNNMNLTLNSKLDSIAKYQGCTKASGFLQLPGPSRQCFKLFTDKSRSWFDAKSKCADEGLAIAKPLNPVAVRSYMWKQIGNSHIWIGARGSGSSVNWERNGDTIEIDSPLWRNGEPGGRKSTNDCLWLQTYESSMKDQPSQPYRMYTCTYTDSATYALCELL